MSDAIEYRGVEGAGVIPTLRSGWKAPALTAADREQALRTIQALDAYLTPARREQVSARVAALLAHFFVPDMPAPLQLAVVNDWVEALAEQPFWAIQQACASWLASNARKPSISDIAARCRRLTREAELELVALRRAYVAKPEPEQADDYRTLPPDEKARLDALIAETYRNLAGATPQAAE